MIQGSYFAGDESLMTARVETNQGDPGDVYPLIPDSPDSQLGFAASLLEADRIAWVITRAQSKKYPSASRYAMYRSWAGLRFRA